MTKKRGKQQRGEKTKKEILHTALELFTEKGYTNVTVDEIVQASSSSKGSFYLHFGSKHNILMEKFKEIDSYYVQVFKDFPSNLSSTEKIILFIQSLTQYIETELGRELMRIIYSHALMPDQNEYFTNQERPLFQILRRLIKEGQTKNELSNNYSTKQIQLMISQTLMGTIYHWCMVSKNYNLEEQSIPVFDNLLSGLSP